MKMNLIELLLIVSKNNSLVFNWIGMMEGSWQDDMDWCKDESEKEEERKGEEGRGEERGGKGKEMKNK